MGKLGAVCQAGGHPFIKWRPVLNAGAGKSQPAGSVATALSSLEAIADFLTANLAGEHLECEP